MIRRPPRSTQSRSSAASDVFSQARHNGVLGHGLAVQAIRARGKPGTRVGIAENLAVGVPVIETSEHIHAAEQATREMNAQYLTVIMEGKYTDAYLARIGADAPHFTPEDLKTISTPMDLSLIHISEPTRLGMISYAVFCLKKKKKKKK